MMVDSMAAAASRDPDQDQDGDRPIGGNELAQGLLLVRASAMNVARLHLAAEGMDRRRMLESMDDLVALDRQIGAFVADIPTSDDGIATLQQRLEEQRRALARDKLALGAGVSLRRAEEDAGPAIAPWRESGANPDASQADHAAGEDMPEQDLDDIETPVSGSAAPWLARAGLLLLIVALVAAAVLYATGKWRELARIIEAYSLL